MSLEIRIQEDIRCAMRQRAVQHLSILRFLWAAVKQKHIDTRLPIDDEMILSVLTKEKKKRCDSIACYQKAGRQDLVEREQLEVTVIDQYLPAPLAAADLEQKIQSVFSAIRPTKMSDMAVIMARLVPELSGRADLAHVSCLVKEKLVRLLDEVKGD